MSVSLEDVKKLREVTGISMMSCKKALDEADGNYEKALEALRKKGMTKAAEKGERTTGEGIIVSYIHSNNKVGSIVKIACETDFVAKNEKFLEFANDIAMHVVAANPLALNPEDIDDAFIAKEKEIWKAQLENEGKPSDKIEMILSNKEQKFREENALLKQEFIKNTDIKVEQLLLDTINIVGENVKIEKFTRYSV